MANMKTASPIDPEEIAMMNRMLGVLLALAVDELKEEIKQQHADIEKLANLMRGCQET
jgi:hypothetical protein